MSRRRHPLINCTFKTCRSACKQRAYCSRYMADKGEPYPLSKSDRDELDTAIPANRRTVAQWDGYIVLTAPGKGQPATVKRYRTIPLKNLPCLPGNRTNNRHGRKTKKARKTFNKATGKRTNEVRVI